MVICINFLTGNLLQKMWEKASLRVKTFRETFLTK